MRLFLYFIISIILYCFASEEFNHTYAVITMIIFLLCCSYVYRRHHKTIEILSFFTIFSLSFFLCNFLYPVFVFPYYPMQIVFSEEFDEKYIMTGETLAAVGYACFALGMNLYLNKKSKYINKTNTFKFKNSLKWSFYIVFLLYFGFIFLLRFLDYSGYNAIITSSFILTLISIFFIIYTLYFLNVFSKEKHLKILKILWKNKVIFLSIAILIFILADVGDRGPIIQLILIILFVYQVMVKRMSFRILLILGLVGISLMVFVRNFRKDFQYERAIEYRELKYGTILPTHIDASVDLMMASRAMYLGLDYVDRNGFLYGKTILRDILSPIPFLPTVVYYILFKETPGQNSTGVIITNDTFSRISISAKSYGLGTNAVVDVYMNFGLIGVIIFMGLFGWIIGIFESQKRSNIYIMCTYCVIAYLPLYIPRSTLFDIIRPIFWSYLIVKIFKSNK